MRVVPARRQAAPAPSRRTRPHSPCTRPLPCRSRDGQEGRQGPQLSFWGVATALSATVKARTSQVLTAVQGTDWRAELEVFQQASVRHACVRKHAAATATCQAWGMRWRRRAEARSRPCSPMRQPPAAAQGAKEDAEAVGKGADEAMHRALEAAEQLEHLPERLPSSAAALQARAEAASAAARARAGAGLAGLAGLGSKLVLGTHDLLEQIRWGSLPIRARCGTTAHAHSPVDEAS